MVSEKKHKKSNSTQFNENDAMDMLKREEAIPFHVLEKNHYHRNVLLHKACDLDIWV